ncbi:NAD(P)/FAD-dependent oxidoreductase [Lentilactobacillus buchneri]|uniref:NAD(P)/FAD-dependent oxidoreductase n=1 Tax=Lentilactobacillus buchneri TaxID=1581 RepID=UPI00020761F8|nr:NAD(P)/FAD-dependent oxidoreductase [Lentilactobacillus buchneri]WCJ52164.1 NAD(P)/FAD-dependent oxidoreductase [Lentilactobacillus sp. Egmn17]AEB73867.1 NADH dehydrogenase (ubiquinone) [Lentilactobacillus buchneri NRRL B-30929]MCT3555482.1 NAD(P)/FAD-dependent oxidoreductase [Lentilactobacillus buchneri]MCT3557188.1 NAD(P)/FAD-dependent oxidoreductase [Lentilactobacillus buchneri]MCT3560396.1 NAD(P)/FAD-dependent oxidoreductase [Lentilactobacillus buchneri]
MTKNIVVIGAGFAGVYATKQLAKRFKSNSDVQITLIDRHSYFTYLTRLHEVATERVDPSSIQYDLQRIFHKQKNVQLVTDNVTSVDKDKKIVNGEHGTYPFDSLLISMGGEPNDFGTPGVKENGFTLWSMEDALRLRAHIREIIGRGAVERDPDKRRAMLTIVVCGSGFTGAETIGELIDYKKVLARDYKLDPDEIHILLVEAAPTIINMLDRTNAAHAEKYIKDHDVEVRPSSMITSVNPDSVDIKDQDSIPTNTLIWTAGVKTNHVADSFGIDAGRGGRLITNQYLQAKGFEDKSIYVAGDDSNATEQGAERAVPQTAQEAENEAVVSSANIAADIEGNHNYTEFHDKNMGFTVSFGARYGIAQVFGGKRVRGWLATIMKHGTNLLYFMRIHSGYFMMQYILQEFFRVDNNRTVLPGITARQGNALWSVPLRMFLGIVLMVDAFSYNAIIPVGFGLTAIEGIIGCLLFFGLFTWIASLALIVIFFMGIASWPHAWIVFAAIALMNGSGRSIGLDYWFVPWLQKTWGRSRYGIPKSLYKNK